MKVKLTRFGLNRANVSGGLRTAFALMLGNAFVGYFVFDKAVPVVAPLFLIGVLGMIVFSLEKKG